MSQPGYILALDQGTSGTTALLVDQSGKSLWKAACDVGRVYPRPGWVEQDPEELFQSCLAAIEELLEETEVDARQVLALGIANQRETVVVWERESGRPVSNAIVWQCRRTASLCEGMKAKGMEAAVKATTGLPIDAYFSGTKIRWILDNIDDGQRRAEAGDLLCGTVDSWLLWKLTGGSVHATDVTNASRTMLLNIDSLAWEPFLLKELDIPVGMLPEVRSSSEVYGYTMGNMFRGQGIPISAVVGDQQAALFGQACFDPGMAKCTYGTGCFILANTGNERVASDEGLLTTVAWKLGADVTYALEGSIFTGGEAVGWLRDNLQIIDSASEVEKLAASVEDNAGLYFVPAFAGLGAPYWDMYARGMLIGITGGTTRAHIARATLEAVAYQTRDVLDAISRDRGAPVPVLRVDGGGAANRLLMRIQADILGIPLQRAAETESSALGVAYMAGLAIGFWSGLDEIAGFWSADLQIEPSMAQDNRELLYAQWRRAVERARGWAAGPD